MKTIQLLEILTKKEKTDFLFVMKLHKRKASYQLLDILIKGKNLDRAQLFTALFHENYKENKDFLLRNELRLLNQQLENFIAQRRLDSKEEKFLVLKAIQKKGLVDLFHKEIKKEIKKCEKENDYESLAKLHQLILDQYLTNRVFTGANLNKMMALNEQILFFEKKAALYKRQTKLVTKAFLNKNLNLSSDSLMLDGIEDVPEKYDDTYLQYLKSKALGYVLSPIERRQNLETALSLIDQIVYYDFDSKAAKVSTLNNLALEYLLAFNYQNAILAYEQLITIGELKGHSRGFVLFNYLNCLLKAGDYEKAIELIEKDFTSEYIPPLLSGKLQCIKAMARVFTGNLDVAYRELSLNTKKEVRNNYFYSRLVLAIIFYLEDNLGLAKREIDNILQVIEDGEQLSYLEFSAKAFRKFFAIEDSSKENFAKRKRLSLSVNEFIHVDNQGSDILPLLWLQKQLGKNTLVK